MNMTEQRKTAEYIISESIKAVLPETAVKTAMEKLPPVEGHIYLAAIGKAAWNMASAAAACLGNRLYEGIVITKYGHSKGIIPQTRIFEAGHPVPDTNTYAATKEVLLMMQHLTEKDLVLFLVSGGGSALFESPAINPDELETITKELLSCGASIQEINTIRKHLSKVKGGRFARHCAPAKVFAVVLSDVIGNPLDVIASGPAYPDESTSEQALSIAGKYKLTISEAAKKALADETPKFLDNVTTEITGSVSQLVQAAAEAAGQKGYSSLILADTVDCEACEAGKMAASIARFYAADSKKTAVIFGGETVVHLKGKGLGGRNQELAVAAAEGISGLKNAAVFSIGSDGTDGPTDAAGGYVDGSTKDKLLKKGISIYKVLSENDAYHALKACDGLIKTGPTGTNVNDVTVILIN